MQEKLSQPKDLTIGKDTLTLEQAKNILQAVVSTHESSITPGISLDQVAGFSTHQIRGAALFFCLNIIKHYGEDNDSYARKQTANGRADLFIRYDQNTMPKTIGFYTNPNFGPILGVDFPLIDPKNNMDRRFVNFFDFRKDKITMLDKPLDIHDYQHLFQGIRLMFANMLNWGKPNIILPENLDHLALTK